jgi:hypothetical protein
MNKNIFIFLISLLIFSCGKKEDKVDNAILRASLALTHGNCQEAIDILELEGRQNSNDTYLKTLASGYACKAGYSTTVLFGTDIPKISDTSLLFREFSTFTSSPNDAVDNANYQNLQAALDIILYAGGLDTAQNPDSDQRTAIFGDKGKDVNAFAFYLSLAQLGKFNYFFGNASPVTGVKGGAGGNPCYLDYNANVDLFLTAIGTTGTCAPGSDSGHPDLVTGADTVDIQYACQGIILFNNFYDTLQSFIASASGDFGSLVNLDVLIDALKLAITTAKPTFDTRLFDTTSQSRCESLFAGNDEDIMYFYAGIFETLHR